MGDASKVSNGREIKAELDLKMRMMTMREIIRKSRWTTYSDKCRSKVGFLWYGSDSSAVTEMRSTESEGSARQLNRWMFLCYVMGWRLSRDLEDLAAINNFRSSPYLCLHDLRNPIKQISVGKTSAVISNEMCGESSGNSIPIASLVLAHAQFHFLAAKQVKAKHRERDPILKQISLRVLSILRIQDV